MKEVLDDPLEKAWNRFISAKQQVRIYSAKEFPSIGVMAKECQATLQQVYIAQQKFNCAARLEYGEHTSILWSGVDTQIDTSDNCCVAGIRLFLDTEVVL